MRSHRGVLFLIAAAASVVIVVGSMVPLLGQDQGYRAPRGAGGKPNISGIWEAMNTANWDIQTHGARKGPVVALGAAFSVPGGLGVVVGEEIPYRPEAAQ